MPVACADVVVLEEDEEEDEVDEVDEDESADGAAAIFFAPQTVLLELPAPRTCLA